MEALKFELERAKNTSVSDEEILSDLRRVSSMLKSSIQRQLTCPVQRQLSWPVDAV